jgi:hypothetical protein
MSVHEEGDSVAGIEDGDMREAIEEGIDRRMAADPDWQAQEAEVGVNIGKYKFSCSGECEQNLQASKLLLLNHGEDWCGNVITICQQCVGWTGSDQAFTKIVRERWTFRSKALFDKEKNLRGLKCEFLEAYYEKKISRSEMEGAASTYGGASQTYCLHHGQRHSPRQQVCAGGVSDGQCAVAIMHGDSSQETVPDSSTDGMVDLGP